MGKCNPYQILVIDGQGGKLGKQLIESIREQIPGAEITAIGTNSIATSNMIKGGADNAATGENPVIVACRDADVIAGPAGIVMADSMLGEVTPAMAVAVAQSKAVKVIIPINRCNHFIAGVQEMTIAKLLEDAVKLIIKALEQ